MESLAYVATTGLNAHAGYPYPKTAGIKYVMHLLSIKDKDRVGAPAVLWSGHSACVLTICQWPLSFSTLIRILNSELAAWTTKVSRTGTNMANPLPWNDSLCPLLSPSSPAAFPAISRPGHILLSPVSRSPLEPAGVSFQTLLQRAFSGHIQALKQSYAKTWNGAFCAILPAMEILKTLLLEWH